MDEQVQQEERRVDRLIRDAQRLQERLDVLRKRTTDAEAVAAAAERDAEERAAGCARALAEIDESVAARRAIADSLSAGVGDLRQEHREFETKIAAAKKALHDTQHAVTRLQSDLLELSASADALRPEQGRLDKVLALITKAETERAKQEEALADIGRDIESARAVAAQARAETNAATQELESAKRSAATERSEAGRLQRRAEQEMARAKAKGDESAELRRVVTEAQAKLVEEERGHAARDATVTRRERGVDSITRQLTQRRLDLDGRESALGQREAAVLEAEARILDVRGELDATANTLAQREQTQHTERQRCQQWADRLRDEEIRLQQQTLDLASLERQRRAGSTPAAPPAPAAPAPGEPGDGDEPPVRRGRRRSE